MKKENIWINIRFPEIKNSCYIELKTTEDKKDYVDYLEFNMSSGKGKHDLLFTLPINKIVDIKYKKPLFFGKCSLNIITDDNDEKLSNLVIERYWFDKATIKKLIKYTIKK